MPLNPDLVRKLLIAFMILMVLGIIAVVISLVTMSVKKKEQFFWYNDPYTYFAGVDPAIIKQLDLKLKANPPFSGGPPLIYDKQIMDYLENKSEHPGLASRIY